MSDPRYIKPGLDQSAFRAIEEMGETTQAITKCLRFGWSGAYPNGESNIAALFREMKDARDALDAMRLEILLSLEEQRVKLPAAPR